jgi:U3 small nucleolar RNA-associated protein 10
MTEYLNVLGKALDKHSKASIAKNAATLTGIITKGLDLRRQKQSQQDTKSVEESSIAAVEANLNEKALKMIYKLNDASFRPIFIQIVEWASSGLAKSDKTGRALRQYSVYGFLHTFFSNLKSIVTNYSTYIVDDAVKILRSASPGKHPEQRPLWARVLATLKQSFEHDQDDFWQAPSHFGAVAPVLMEQFLHAPSIDVEADLIPAVVELAERVASPAPQKELNTALMQHLKSDQRAVRLAAVKCEQELMDRLGEEWLTMLTEMLPRISELQEDDDEEVERETHRWIIKIEAVLGEPLDAMLQ